jgi:hypothetical protein
VSGGGIGQGIGIGVGIGVGVGWTASTGRQQRTVPKKDACRNSSPQISRIARFRHSVGATWAILL